MTSKRGCDDCAGVGYYWDDEGVRFACRCNPKDSAVERERLRGMQAEIDRRTAAQLGAASITLGPGACSRCGIVDPPGFAHAHQDAPLHMDSEIVICAAVRDIHGRVFRCHRHHHGLALLGARWASRSRDLADAAQQGFVTSRNRYVDRREALRLQRAAGIESVAPGGYRGEQLFSEDLY